MLGIELTGEAPFHTVYLSGLIRDPYGAKMSKTKGNTVDPLATIEEVGADALRFAVVHGATPGNDQRFGPAKVENARNFANKLWNATRFVLGARPATIPADAERRLPDVTQLGPAERWVLSRAAATTAAVDKAMADYAFGEVTRILYEAIWNEYCDWGLELAKVRLNDASLPDAEREATWWALVEALDTYLRLLHPVMPFLTEQLWQALPHRATDPDAADRGPLAGSGGAGRGGRGRGRRPRRPRPRGPQRPRRREARARRMAAARRVRGAGPRPRTRGAAAGPRAPRPRATAPPAPDARGPARDGGGRRRAGRHRRARGGDRRDRRRRTRAPPRQTGHAWRRSSATPSACSMRRGPAWPTRHSSARRRRPSSRAPGRARRSSPTRSSG